MKGFVEVAGIVVHHNVQVLFICLVGIKRVLHFEDVGVVEDFEDLQFSVFIFFILKHPFDCHLLQGLFVSSLVDDPESSTSCLVFEDVASRAGGAFRFFPFLFFLISFHGMRDDSDGVDFFGGSEDLVDGLAMSTCQSIDISNLGIEFGGWWFEVDALVRIGVFEGEGGLALIENFFIFCEGGFGFVGVEAGLLVIFADVCFDPAGGGGFLFGRTQLQF